MNHHWFRRDLLLLGAICAVLYGVGLTTHGLTNWQEAQRAVVAREMQRRVHDGAPGALVVPTNCGSPYLAKPPLMYWAQVALAEVRGRETGEFELRAVVALAGTAGVLATYWCALIVLSPMRAGVGSRGRQTARKGVEGNANVAAAGTVWAAAPSTIPRDRAADWPRLAALWAALCLATGILYVRSSRIGELDILLVPSVALAIGGIARSWRRHLERAETDVAGIVLAAIAATAVVMTKGPAGLAVIALGAYGGIALWTAHTRQPLEAFLVPRFKLPSGRVVPSLPPPSVVEPGHTPSTIVWLVTLTAAAVVGVVSLANASSLADILGALLHALAAGCIAMIVVRLSHPLRLKAYWTALTRTHPVGVLGVPILVFYLWWREVVSYIGHDAAIAAAMGEADDNLHWFAPDAIIVNLEALAYGVGLGSIACAVCLIWIAKDRPRVRPGLAIALAWLVLGAWIFAVSTKGVVRYLTPVWPSVAILGGMLIATRVLESRRRGLVSVCFGVVVAVLLFVQTWWYGFGRERYFAERSPRALVYEAIGRFQLDPARFATFELRTPAIDFYAGRPVLPVGEIGMRESMSGLGPISLENLAAKIRESSEPMVVFVRLSGPDALGRRDLKPAVDRLAEAGFTIAVLNTQRHFVTDSGRSIVGIAIVDVNR